MTKPELEQIAYQLQMFCLARRHFAAVHDAHNYGRIDRYLKKVDSVVPGIVKKASDGVIGCGAGLGPDVLQSVINELNDFEPALEGAI